MPISQQLQQRILDVAPTARVIVEARVEQTADIRQRADQWNNADGGLPANIEQLADGGIRLKATAGAAVGSDVQNAWYRNNETGYTSGNRIDPIANAPVPRNTFIGVSAAWFGTSVAAAYGSAKAWLHPRLNNAASKEITGGTWELVLSTVDFQKNQDGSRVYDRNNDANVRTLVPVLTV